METTAGVIASAISATEPGSRTTPSSTSDSCESGSSSGDSAAVRVSQ